MPQKKSIVPQLSQQFRKPLQQTVATIDRVVQGSAGMHALLGTFIKVLDTSEHVHAE
jgi:hypothetical protein